MLILAQRIVTPRTRARVSNPGAMRQLQKTMILQKRATDNSPGGLIRDHMTTTHHYRSAPRLVHSSAHCGVDLQGSFLVLDEDITWFVLPGLLVLLPQSTLLVDDAPQ